MKLHKIKIISLILLVFFINNSFSIKENNIKIKIVTSKGEMIIELFKETPLHSQHFIELVKSGFYEGISFNRVINEFMAQAGEPNSKIKNFEGK